MAFKVFNFNFNCLWPFGWISLAALTFSTTFLAPLLFTTSPENLTGTAFQNFGVISKILRDHCILCSIDLNMVAQAINDFRRNTEYGLAAAIPIATVRWFGSLAYDFSDSSFRWNMPLQKTTRTLNDRSTNLARLRCSQQIGAEFLYKVYDWWYIRFVCTGKIKTRNKRRTKKWNEPSHQEIKC